MELVTILRELWRLRAAVVVVALLAVLVGLAVAVRLPSFESRSYEVGTATASVLVDTPNSAVVEVAPRGSDLLGVRANLIASLMTDGAVKDSIAQAAGIPPARLRGISESAAEPAADAKVPRDQDYVLSTRVLAASNGDRLPIIEVEAKAPDAARAAALAAASVSGLRDYLDSKAAAEQVTDARRLRVSGLGAPQARTVVEGDRRLVAIVGALLVFLAGCAGLVAAAALIRSWRVAAAWDGLEDGGPPAAPDPDDVVSFDEFLEGQPTSSEAERRLRVTTPVDYERPDDDDDDLRRKRA